MWIRIELIQESGDNTQLSRTLAPPPIPYIQSHEKFTKKQALILACWDGQTIQDIT